MSDDDSDWEAEVTAPGEVLRLYAKDRPCYRCQFPERYSNTSYCRGCYSAMQREQRARHIDKRRAYDRARPSRPNPERDRATKLMRDFGMTVEQYDAMVIAQGGVCAICRRPESKVRRGKVLRLAVDHCHETRRVRGLLCNDCNLGLGKFEDDPARMRAAISYLEQAR